MPIEHTRHLVKIKEPETLREQQYISGALVATNIAIAVQLLQLTSLSPSLTVALWCISISIPGLAFDFLLNIYTIERGYVLHIYPSLKYEVVYVGVVLIALTAVAAVIYHFQPMAAYTFSALSVLAFYRLGMYVRAVEEELDKKSE
jgi:hypothetical protein